MKVAVRAHTQSFTRNRAVGLTNQTRSSFGHSFNRCMPLTISRSSTNLHRPSKPSHSKHSLFTAHISPIKQFGNFQRKQRFSTSNLPHALSNPRCSAKIHRQCFGTTLRHTTRFSLSQPIEPFAYMKRNMGVFSKIKNLLTFKFLEPPDYAGLKAKEEEKKENQRKKVQELLAGKNPAQEASNASKKELSNSKNEKRAVLDDEQMEEVTKNIEMQEPPSRFRSTIFNSPGASFALSGWMGCTIAAYVAELFGRVDFVPQWQNLWQILIFPMAVSVPASLFVAIPGSILWNRYKLYEKPPGWQNLSACFFFALKVTLLSQVLFSSLMTNISFFTPQGPSLFASYFFFCAPVAVFVLLTNIFWTFLLQRHHSTIYFTQDQVPVEELFQAKEKIDYLEVEVNRLRRKEDELISLKKKLETMGLTKSLEEERKFIRNPKMPTIRDKYQK